NQMAEDIEQGGRERELMLAGVSHDLRTPLTRLRLSLELLPESEREMVEDMIRDIEDMDAILDQFLAFIRDGRDEPVEEGDLTDLVREVVAPFNQTREQVRMALQ
ncbi:histidine kinase dimerization/phospho-acceptor domain-containing protein, partial [Klebsiella variicola]